METLQLISYGFSVVFQPANLICMVQVPEVEMRSGGRAA
jgi:hypothetical protein